MCEDLWGPMFCGFRYSHGHCERAKLRNVACCLNADLILRQGNFLHPQVFLYLKISRTLPYLSKTQGTPTSFFFSVLTAWLRAFLYSLDMAFKNIIVAVIYLETVSNKTKQINI